MSECRTVGRVNRRPVLPALTAALAAAGLVSFRAHAQLQTAGELFVRVDATQLPEGTLKSIANAGTLGGFFEARGAEGEVPVIAKVGGTKGILFDGTDFMQLVKTLGGDVTPAPAGLVGENAACSIEVWALNPAVAGEETLVSWGHRGGPDGSNLAFNYGSDFRWGAVGHWGSPDLGWNSAGGNPEAGKWHHLVYTYDGTTTRVYSDGKLANFEILADGVINTYEDTAINLATQLESNGTTPTPGLRGSLTLGRVRIHDGVLTAAQIATNYTTEKPDFIDPEIPPPVTIDPERLTKGPVHRYSFSEAGGVAAEGAVFKDSVGKADGKVAGAGATFTGSRLKLPGGPSAEAPYGDLPNGLLSSNSTNNGGTGGFTFEGWVKITGSSTWSRIFDFGSTSVDGAGGEVEAPGGGGNGLDYLFLSAQIGDDTGNRRMEVRNEDPAGGGIVTADSRTSSFGKDAHVVVTWKESTGRITLYENGRELTGLTTDDAMSDINDVNVWLGRSNWTADRNVQGEFDEVRLYDYALTPGQALGGTLAGPDLLNDKDAPVKITLPPQPITIAETFAATFEVSVSGSTPVKFQWRRNGQPIPGATGRTYTIPSASSTDGGSQYSVEVSNTVNGTPVIVLSEAAALTVVSDTLTLVHRYSFSETTGTKVSDSVGTAHGEAKGGATFGGGQLELDGSEGSFVDLPNGMITALGDNATFELWTTYAGGRPWSRVFDFGTSAGGEDVSDGAPNGADIDYLFYTPKSGDGIPLFVANFPGGGDTTTLTQPGSFPVGQQQHAVITYSATGNSARLYIDGQLVAVAPVPKKLSALNGRDVNVWLGRSQFPDPNFAGRYNEFRIYKGAMSAAQVTANFAAGPDTILRPIPKLSIQDGLTAGTVVLTWPAAETGLFVERSPSVGTGAVWTKVGDGTPVVRENFRITVNADQAAQYFRLNR